MKDLQFFENAELGLKIRVLADEKGNPLFVANELAKGLGYSTTAAMTRTLDDDEKGVQIVHTLGGNQQMTVITESGFYHAALKSRVPQAIAFRKWVTAVVLPAIRQTGAYMTQQTIIQVMQQPESILSICKKLIELNDENKRLAPKAEYAEQVLLSPTCYTMTQVAKSLSMTVQELQHCLHDMGIIYRSPSGPWMLYAPYLKQGYEAYRTKTGENLFGDVLWTNTYLVWTETGRQFITNMLKHVS